MTELDYECHITIETNTSPEAHATIQELVQLLHWRFSKIDGDPQLGIGVRCYATQLYHDEDLAIMMTQQAAKYLSNEGCDVVRQKVEHVVYDTKEELTNK